MPDERTNWPRVYALGVLLGAGFGLLLSVGVLPSAPDWPPEWDLVPAGPVASTVVPLVGGSVVGLALAAVAHLGVVLQMRRRSDRRLH